MMSQVLVDMEGGRGAVLSSAGSDDRTERAIPPQRTPLTIRSTWTQSKQSPDQVSCVM